MYLVLNRKRRRNGRMLRQLEQRQEEMRGLSREAWELLDRLPAGVGRSVLASQLCMMPHDAIRYGKFIEKVKGVLG